MAVLAACGGGTEVAGTSEVREIVVDGAPSLPLDQTTRLSATVRDAAGQPLAGRTIFWATSDSAVATVDQTGLVTPHALGRVQIAASAEGRSGVFAMDVVRKRVRTLSLVATAEVAVGDTIVLEVSARAGDGDAVVGAAPTFASTAPEVASVTADGRVVGRATGTAGIVASVDGIADTTTVSVVPTPVASLLVEPAEFELSVGQTLPLRVTARDRNGAPLAGRTASYASSAPAVASVSADGNVQALSAGTATITVRSGTASATSRVTVAAPVAPPPSPPSPPSPPAPRPPKPASLAIDPPVATLHVGATRALSATLRDTEGAIVTGRAVSWTSGTPSIATVSATGVVTAIAAGGAVITAQSEGISASAGITVTPAPVARVVVTPPDAALPVGETRRLTAEARDAGGAALAGRAVAWTTSNPGVATVSSTGEVRAVATGVATITAAAEGVRGTARITVTPPPPPGAPAKIERVSGDNQKGEEGETLDDPIVVRVVDAAGRPVAGVEVRWVAPHGGSFTPAVSTTDASGLATSRWRLGSREGRHWAQVVVAGLTPVSIGAVANDD